VSFRIARPLPECPMCETPVRRATFLENGGLCPTCRAMNDELGDTVQMTRLPPAPDQFLTDATVNVERYTPPVPGQLALDEDQS
jgi:hypothetical protein